MTQADEIWNKLIKQQIVKKSSSPHKPDTKIYLAFEPNINKAFGITEPMLPRTYHIAFTSLAKLEKFMKNLHSIGVVHSKQYRAFPTTFDEYFTHLKAKFGNLDLVIDPPNDFKMTDSSLFTQ